jgi:hypothetical protein
MTEMQPVPGRRLCGASALNAMALLPWLAQAESAVEIRPSDLTSVKHYSPCAFRSYPDRVLFGDMHIHSNLSPDADLLETSLTAARFPGADGSCRGNGSRPDAGGPLARPRWTTFEAARLGVKLPTRVPETVQDRVYTSSVWYSPGK